MEYKTLWKAEFIQGALNRYNYNTNDDMYASVGFGTMSPTKIITRVLEEYKKVNQEEETVDKKIEALVQKQSKKVNSNAGIIVKGIDNCLVKLSKCCNPVPGDNIVGYITKGRGVTIHRIDCKNIKELLSEENRMIDVYWYNNNSTYYAVDLIILANDRVGLLADLLAEIKKVKCRLIGVNSKIVNEKNARVILSIEVENVIELNNVRKSLNSVEGVYEIKRRK